MTKVTVLLCIIIISSQLIRCNDDKTVTPPKGTAIVNYYAKRWWCPEQKKFFYYEQKSGIEESLTNYYKVIAIETKNNKGEYVKKLQKEQSFKDIDVPHGSWYLYNDKEQIIKEKVYKNGVFKEVFEYEYTKNGKKKKVKHKIIDNKNKKIKLKVETRYFYNPVPKKTNETRIAIIEVYHGAVIDEKTKEYKTILDEKIEFNYNPKGLLARKNISLFEILKSYNIYSYDDKNNLIKDEIYDPTSKKLSYLEYKYNKDNKLIEEKYFEINDKSEAKLQKQYLYVYDKKGRRIKVSESALIEKKNNEKFIKLYDKYTCYNNTGCIKGYFTVFNDGKIITKGDCKGPTPQK